MYERLTMWHRNLNTVRCSTDIACIGNVFMYLRDSRMVLVKQQCDSAAMPRFALFRNVHPMPHNISEDQRSKWCDFSRCSCIRGSWWCWSHTSLWACALAMLIVTGENIQCCPLLTDRNVWKRGDNCLKKSRGAVCGNTPYPTSRTSSSLWYCVLPISMSFFCAHCDPGVCHVAGVENITVDALKLCWHYMIEIFQIPVLLFFL